MKQFLLLVIVLLFIGACSSKLPNIYVGDVIPTEALKEIRLLNIESIEINSIHGDKKEGFGFDQLCIIPPNKTVMEEVVAKNKNFVALRISYTENWLGGIYCPNSVIYLDEIKNFAKRKQFFQKIEEERLERRKTAEELLRKK